MNIVQRLYIKILDIVVTDNWYRSLTEVDINYLLEDNPNRAYHESRLESARR